MEDKKMGAKRCEEVFSDSGGGAVATGARSPAPLPPAWHTACSFLSDVLQCLYGFRTWKGVYQGSVNVAPGNVHATSSRFAA